MLECVSVDIDMQSGVSILGTRCDTATSTTWDEVRVRFPCPDVRVTPWLRALGRLLNNTIMSMRGGRHASFPPECPKRKRASWQPMAQ